VTFQLTVAMHGSYVQWSINRVPPFSTRSAAPDRVDQLEIADTKFRWGGTLGSRPNLSPAESGVSAAQSGNVVLVTAREVPFTRLPDISGN
jgi:hypothetical protein